MAEAKTVPIANRYILQEKFSGKYYKPSGYPNWTEDIRKAKLYTNSGHCRLAKTSYLSYRDFPTRKARQVELARQFDGQYRIISIRVAFDV